MKPLLLFLLGIAQLTMLGLGITILSALAPDLHIENPLTRNLVGALALVLIVGGLTCRDYIRVITHKPSVDNR